jgi:hypothetical protein
MQKPSKPPLSIHGHEARGISRDFDKSETKMVDLQAALESRFGSVSTTRMGGRLHYVLETCPFQGCKRKLYVTPSMQIYRCFRCESVGRIENLIRSKYVVNPDAMKVKPRRPVCLECGDLVKLDTLEPQHRALKYLVARGFDPQEVQDIFGCRYCVDGPGFGQRESGAPKYVLSNTLVFPVWMHGQLKGWQSRLLYSPDKVSDAKALQLWGPENGKPWRPSKYWTAPGMAKSEVVFNLDMAAKHDIGVVCEGVFDAMKTGVNGMAIFGKSISDIQVRLIADRFSRVVVILDPDAQDRQNYAVAALRSAGTQAVGLRVPAKDPGDCTREQIQECINAIEGW